MDANKRETTESIQWAGSVQLIPKDKKKRTSLRSDTRIGRIGKYIDHR